MDKLSALISHLIIQVYLRPRRKILNELDVILENEIKENKSKMLLFLISILLSTIIIPLVITYPEHTLANKLKWSGYYLLFFILITLIIGAYYDAIKNFKVNDCQNLAIETTKTCQNLPFKTDINYKDLSENLILKNAFRCELEDLIKVFSGWIPSNKIAITYVGTNGRVSYHNLFFTLHYLLENGIVNIKYEKRKELLVYITHCFKKDDQKIRLKTLNQNYIDWKNQKFNERNVNEYLKEFITPVQSA